MEPVQSVLEFLKSLLCYHIAANNVAKFQECTEGLHNIIGNMALDGWQIDLSRQDVKRITRMRETVPSLRPLNHRLSIERIHAHQETFAAQEMEVLLQY